MVSNLLAMASNLEAMASYLSKKFLSVSVPLDTLDFRPAMCVCVCVCVCDVGMPKTLPSFLFLPKGIACVRPSSVSAMESQRMLSEAPSTGLPGSGRPTLGRASSNKCHATSNRCLTSSNKLRI